MQDYKMDFLLEHLQNEYGLSCVENYSLLYMAQNINNWKLIFYQSYLPFDAIVDAIFEGQTYSTFFGIKRLHKVAEEAGILEINRYNCDAMQLKQIRCDLLMLQVKPKYMEEKYHKSTWRDDHYIAVKKKSEKSFWYINDLPADSGVLSSDEVEEVFAGRAIAIKGHSANLSEVDVFYREAYKHIIHNVAQKNKNDKWKRLEYQQIRDVIGIKKVITKRMEGLLSEHKDTYDITSYYEYLCECYIKVEYYRIRRKKIEEIADMIRNIRDRDYCVYNKIKDLLRESDLRG